MFPGWTGALINQDQFLSCSNQSFLSANIGLGPFHSFTVLLTWFYCTKIKIKASQGEGNRGNVKNAQDWCRPSAAYVSAFFFLLCCRKTHVQGVSRNSTNATLLPCPGGCPVSPGAGHTGGAELPPSLVGCGCISSLPNSHPGVPRNSCLQLLPLFLIPGKLTEVCSR